MSTEFLSPVTVNDGETFIIPTEIAYQSGNLDFRQSPKLQLYVPPENQLTTELFFAELQQRIISEKQPSTSNRSPEDIFYGSIWSLQHQIPNL